MTDDNSTLPIKRCSICGNEYPATADYFCRNKTHKFGLDSRCKACKSAQAKVRVASDPEKYKQKSREYTKRYTDKHPERVRESQKRWFLTHIEQEQARWKMKNIRDHDKRIQQSREYKDAHREEIRQKERERRRINPIPFRTKINNYRSKKRAAGEHTAEDVDRQYVVQKGKCYYCGRKLNRKFHVEHVVPLSRGGRNTPDNLVIACAKCNKTKGDKMPHEWPEGGRLL